MLKMTKIQLDSISDQDMYLFLMDTIRGGITVCNKKYLKADNIYILEFNMINGKMIKLRKNSKKIKNK